jgi:hypothetical protein
MLVVVHALKVLARLVLVLSVAGALLQQTVPARGAAVAGAAAARPHVVAADRMDPAPTYIASARHCARLDAAARANHLHQGLPFAATRMAPPGRAGAAAAHRADVERSVSRSSPSLRGPPLTI